MSTGGQAADMPLKAPVMPAPPPFSWTGFYLGGNIGAAWANASVTDNISGQTFSRSSDAVFIGGGQLGVNYQFNTFVIGAEWDFDGTVNNNNRAGGGLLINGAGPFAVTNPGERWLTTVAARLGFAIDHWLLYSKVGWGSVGVRDITVTNLANGAFVNGGGRSSSGFMFGFGFEYAFLNNFTMKAEYNFIDVPGRSFTVPAAANLPAGFPVGIAGDVFSTRNSNVQAFKVGFNYLFGRGGF